MHHLPTILANPVKYGNENYDNFLKYSETLAIFYDWLIIALF